MKELPYIVKVLSMFYNLTNTSIRGNAAIAFHLVDGVFYEEDHHFFSLSFAFEAIMKSFPCMYVKVLFVWSHLSVFLLEGAFYIILYVR